MAVLLIYLLLINAVTFFMYWDDKKMARKKYAWRTSEKRLFFYAIAGGTPAAFLACYKLRHKTSKTSFVKTLWGIAAAQILLVLYVVI